MKGSPFSDQVRELIRTRQFSYSTEKSYVGWIYRYINFHEKKHPKEMGERELAKFLTYLAVERRVFVFSRKEALSVLSNLQGEYRLMASLLYGGGLRLSECLGLRVKDIDFEPQEIIVRAAKGNMDRRTILPASLIPTLNFQIEKVRLRLEENKLLQGFRGASMPEAPERKLPTAALEPAWQYLFPARKPALDPRSGTLRQHCRHESFLQKADGYNIRTVQELLGHMDVRSTMSNTHVLDRNKYNVVSPLDS